MNIAPRYLGRGSWLARRDPRVLVLVVVLFIITVIQVWDGRVMAALLALSLLYYQRAGIRFADVRRNWIAALTLLTIVVLVNTVLTGNRLEGVPVHPFFTIPLFGTVVSAESISLRRHPVDALRRDGRDRVSRSPSASPRRTSG